MKPKCEKCKRELRYDCINDVFICEDEKCEGLNRRRYALKEAYLVAKSGLK